MLHRSGIFFLLLITGYTCRPQLQPVGRWREHLPYHQATHVLFANNTIWAATPYSLFSVDVEENSIERFSKINGLTETGISAIGFDAGSNQLIIAYNNSSIDLLDGGDIVTIDAIKNSPVTGNKTIHAIFTYNGFAWLSTGIGIIRLDLQKKEVKDTWIIGSGGAKIHVEAVTTDGNFLYAATAEGLKAAPVNAANLADFRTWQLLSGSNGLSAGAVRSAVTLQNKVMALKDDSLFLLTGTSWSFLYHDGWNIKDITITEGKALLSETLNNTGRIVVLSAAGIVEKIIQHTTYTASPRQAIMHQNNYWIADTLGGLSKYNGSSFEAYVPNSPPSIATGSMQVLHNTLWVAGGAGGLHTFKDTWSFLNATNLPQLDTFPDFVTVAIDPANGSIWGGSYGGGLVNIKSPAEVTTYKQQSPLQPAYFAPGSYRISGLAFDADHHLWIANYGGTQNLHVRKADGTWRSFTVPYPLVENGVSQIVIDDVHQKWIIAPNNNGIICFHHGQSVDNPGDDKWKWYRSGAGNGNLPDNQVLCLAKDKNNFIWAGTARGIGIIQCTQEVFSSQGCEAILPVVQNDNFAGYLFRDEQVQAIAVDGADRKWIGTRNGVWLISPDGQKTIYRFTTANSPLFSNDVQQIAIDGQTGEVFFATAKGICSFRSTATEGSTANSQVLVFPNPVPPGYNGAIAIRGVANNAIVKIAELDGRLVYETRALGGQAIWNGKDYKGRSIASGIYLVLVSDDGRQEKTVTKIVFVQR
jgi:ligand-binding sensor domain-containing protein